MANMSTFGQPLALREAMSWFFNESAAPSTGRTGAGGPDAVTEPLPINLYSTPEHYTLRALLPGALPDTIEVTYARGTLTIRAAIPRPPAPQGEEMTWYYRELGTGTYSRTIPFREAIDADRIESSFANGVLTLTLPKAEAAKPKKIAVTGGAPDTASAGDDRHPIREKVRKSVPNGRRKHQEDASS